MASFLKLIRSNYHHLLESFFFSLAAAVLNVWMFADAPMYKGYALNPYLVIPILMSLRYGSLAGFTDFLITMTVAISSCYYLGTLNYIFDEGWIFIIAVMLIAQLAGQISDAMRDQLVTMKSEFENLQMEFGNLIQNNLALADANRELTRRIVSRFDSLTTVYEAAKKLETLDKRELYPATMEILKNQIMVRKASIYEKVKDSFEFAAAIDDVEHEKHLKVDKGMLARAVESGELVSYLPFLEGRTQKLPTEESGDFIAVVPIRVQNVVCGIILIEDMAFMDFTRSSLKMLEIVSDWVGSSMSTIEDFLDASRSRMDDPDTYGYKARYMMNQFMMELSKAVRYSLPFSIVKLDVQDAKGITVDNLNNVSSVIGFVLRNYKREIDIFGSTGQAGSFMVLLPVTDRKGMEIFVNRIRQEIKAFGFKPYKDESRILELDIRMVSLFDLIVQEKLEVLPRGEVRTKTDTILSEMSIILDLEAAD